MGALFPVATLSFIEMIKVRLNVNLKSGLMQLPMSMGGLAPPNFKHYYWATVLVTVQWWFAQLRGNPVVNSKAALLGSYAELSNVAFRGSRVNSNITMLMCITIRVRTFLNEPNIISPFTPLRGNPSLPHLQSIPDP